MNYNIPLFDLNYGKEERKAVLDTLRSGWISTGPKCHEFETRFAEMLNVNHAVSLSSCTGALHLSLRILGIKEDDEVITPSLTFVATVNAIRYVNAIPVFCDIRSYNDLTVDPDSLEELITPNTKAIIVMHYAGFPCDMDKIMAIAHKYNLKVLEDACHGPLSEYKGRKLGTIGDLGCFSFFSNKNISTGEGGMLVTNNRQFYKKAVILRSHGMTSLSYERFKGHNTSYDVLDLGYNYRMDDLRAALGLAQLCKLKDDLLKRAEIRKRYVEKFSAIDGLIVPFKDYQGYVSNYIFPVLLVDSTAEKRDMTRKELHEKGIQSSVHYPAVHKFSIYDKGLNLPKTEYVSDNLITLPLYSQLKKRQVDYIIDSVRGLIS